MTLSDRLLELSEEDRPVSRGHVLGVLELEAELACAKVKLDFYEGRMPWRKDDRNEVVASDKLVQATELAVRAQSTGMFCPAVSNWVVRQIITRLRVAESKLAEREQQRQ